MKKSLATAAIALSVSGLLLAGPAPMAFAKNGADDTHSDDNGGRNKDKDKGKNKDKEKNDDNPGASDGKGKNGSKKKSKKITRGLCTDGTTKWKLKVEKKNRNRLKVNFEVDSNTVGQVWAVNVTHNGTVVVNRDKTTRGVSGSLEVERKVKNQAGTDTFAASATRASDGATCTASRTF